VPATLKRTDASDCSSSGWQVLQKSSNSTKSRILFLRPVSYGRAFVGATFWTFCLLLIVDVVPVGSTRFAEDSTSGGQATFERNTDAICWVVLWLKLIGSLFRHSSSRCMVGAFPRTNGNKLLPRMCILWSQRSRVINRFSVTAVCDVYLTYPKRIESIDGFRLGEAVSTEIGVSRSSGSLFTSSS
jgi:hypothetical protein